MKVSHSSTAARGGDRADLRHCGLWRQEPNQEPRGPPEESERTFVPDQDDPLPPKERKRSAAGGE